MTDIDQRHPEFALAIRGYDRDQVDNYVRRLRELLAAAEARARAAEPRAAIPAPTARAEPEPEAGLSDEVAELERRKAELATELRRLHDVLGSTLRSIAPDRMPA